MNPTVRLEDVINEMDALGTDFHAYINSKTLKLVTLSDEVMAMAEDGVSKDEVQDWEWEEIQKAKEVFYGTAFISLPDRFEIHEYRIMERFCYSVKDDNLREKLIQSIRGRGAFRYFKDTIYEHGIADDWYEYRYEAIRKIAIDFLEEHNISYVEAEKE